jgi:hypothetical protein
MVRRLIGGICSHGGGLILLGSAIGILAGVERLCQRQRSRKPSDGNAGTAGPDKPRVREDYFQIRRTKSEFGYVYWYLQGHGRFRCFLLFDTWREAMDEANARIAQSVSPQARDQADAAAAELNVQYS